MKLVKGLILTSAFALIIGLGSEYASTNANSNEAKEFIPKTEEEKAWSNYVDEEVKTKMSEAFNDSFKTYGINADEYNYYSMHTKSNLYKEIDAKQAVLLRIAAIKAIKKDITSGDFMPGIFVKKDGTKAFVTFKALNTGENYIYWFSPTPANALKANNKSDTADYWTLEKTEEKEGQKLEKLKLKSLEEFSNDN